MFTKDQFGNITLDLNGKKKGEGQLQQAEVPPQSPLMAEQNGVSPDAAKMAGTPAQTNAVRSEVVPNTLQEADKAQQRQAEQGAMTAQQQKQAAEAARLRETYGEMGSRIQNIIDQGAYILGSPVAGQSPDQSQQAKYTVNTEGLNESQASLLNDYAANPTPQKREALIKAGVADPESKLKGDLAGTIKEGLSSGLNLTADIIQQLGATPEELAEVLGVPVDELQGKTIQELQNALTEGIQSEFSTIERVVSDLNNPALTPHDRQLLKQELRQMGASGVYATEQEMEFLEQELNNAGTVEFNGQRLKLEDLLSDEYVSKLITQYAESPLDSEFRKELEKNEPALAEFIKKHEAAFKELGLHMDAVVEEYDTIKQSRDDAASKIDNLLGGDKALVSSLSSALGLGDGEFTQFDPTQYPGMSWLLNGLTSGTISREAIPNLKELVKGNPNLAAAVLKMSEADIKKLGLEKERGVARLLSASAKWDKVQKLDPKNPDAIAKELFGVSYSDLGKILEEAKKAQLMGITPSHYASLKQFIDPSGSFKLASPEQILKAMKDKLGNGKWESNPAQFSAHMDLARLTDEAKKQQKNEVGDIKYSYLTLPPAVKKKIDSGKTIEPSDFSNDFKAANVTTERLNQLTHLLKSPLLSPSAKKFLNDELQYVHSSRDFWNGSKHQVGLEQGIGTYFEKSKYPADNQKKIQELVALRDRAQAALNGASGKTKEYYAHLLQMINKAHKAIS